MTIESVFRTLFPGDEYQSDAAALRQIREEVECLREQLAVRIGDVRRTMAEFIRQTQDEDALAAMLLVSRDMVEQAARIQTRGMLPAEKSVRELQRAHDIVISLIKNPAHRIAVFGEDSPETLGLMSANCDVLCWALGHTTYNGTFAENLAGIEAAMFARGFTLGAK
jgi:hypothetical protein